MPIFERKTTTCDAEQFVDMVNPPRGVLVDDDNERFYVVTLQGQEVEVKPGEWIVAEHDGFHFYPIADEEFKRIYKPKPRRSKPILCLDFDGVIHSYTSGWKGADNIPDLPVIGSMAFIQEALEHFRIAIHSSRSGQPGGIAAMQGYIRHWALAQTGQSEWTHKIEWPETKPPAFLTIDDRAFPFCGEWPRIEDLKNFRTWNQKS